MLKLNKNVTGTNKLTLSELKNWIKVETTADDTLLTSLISQSREIIEGYLNMSLVETEITGYTDKYEFQIPYQPLVELTSVKSLDGDVDLSYDLVKDNVIIYDRLYKDVVKFTYTAGIDDIDDGLLLAWEMFIAYIYENRGDNNNIFDFLYKNSTLNRYKKLNLI